MKVNCTNPAHEDRNASMEVYEDGAYCFSCGWIDRGLSGETNNNRQPEDIEKTFEYIDTLPSRIIRGLDLPYDEYGYFIVWPDRSYYKKRMFSGGTRYLAPYGKTPPLLVYGAIDKHQLAIVEGELNALTLYNAVKGRDIAVCSPGSAMSLIKPIDKYLLSRPKYVIVDKDAAGAAAGITLKRELLRHGKRVELIACDRDLNQILQDFGSDGIKRWVEENL